MLRTLNEIRNLTDPLKQFVGDISIVVPSGIKHLCKNTDKLTMRCTSYDYPSAEVKTTNVIIAGYQRTRPSLQNRSGTMTLKFTETLNGEVVKLFSAWCDLEHQPFGNVRLSSKYYIGSAVLSLGKRMIKLHGFYPTKYNVPSINPSSSDSVEITVTFNYDFWEEM